MSELEKDNLTENTNEPKLRIIPLGGLGEIGLNCMALEYDGSILVIDAGLMFPDSSSMPGVDLVIPDFSYLWERADQVVGLILTHGHEDHIGAAGYLLKGLAARRREKFPDEADSPELKSDGVTPPVGGTRLTLALARERIKESWGGEVEFREVEPRQKLSLGPFELEFISVNHSIVDGVAVAVGTPAGTVIHTGDFKIDQNPETGDRIDLFKFAEYGEKGVLALLSDSTNADVPGFTDSEFTVGQSLTRIFTEAPGRVILACFASSLARIRQVALAAKAAGRKLAFEGRGMVNIVKLAKNLGYLQLDEEAETTLAAAADLPDDQLVIVATGSQGEPMSALARMAYGEHKHIRIKSGDTVILSARSIPGHEKAITQLINRFYRQGALVVDGRAAKVHASGHGQAEELKLMLSLTRPRYVIPVHGEARQLVKHGELALGLGWGPERIWVLEDGQRLALSQSEAILEEPVSTGRKVVDGNRLGEPEDPVLRSRLRLADGGLVIITAVLAEDDGRLLAPPQVIINGVHYENDFDLTLETAAVTRGVIEEWRRRREPRSDGEAAAGPPPDAEELTAMIQREARALFRQSLSRRPAIWPQVIWAPRRPDAAEETSRN